MSKSTPTDKAQENKQLIGSSKRKRKSSIIKRNIHVDESNDSSKTEKSPGKKLKTEKTKSDGKKDKNLDGPEKKVPEGNDTNENEGLAKDEIDLEEVLLADEGRKPRGKTKSAEKGCSSSKQQCQNCSFCSEHKPVKEEEEDEGAVKAKKKYTCDHCAKMGMKRVYNSLEKYKHHVSLLHEKSKEDVKRFECTDCPEPVWFPTKSKFCYHLGAKHPGIIKFICEVCTETFKLKANYKNHMKTHNIVVQKKFSCDVCNGTFVNRAGFEAHKKRFPGPHIKQNCSHCGFSFSREKHMKNHRCKKLLLEEAARANSQTEMETRLEVFSQEATDERTNEEPRTEPTFLTIDVNMEKEMRTEENPFENKTGELAENNKKIVFHRIVPRRSQDQTIYRPVQMQTAQNVPESVVVQEIDLENSTFIATAEDQQIILRDVNGHLVQGNQILQLDLNDIQPGEESQVYLADWNVVAPTIMIREKSP